MPTIELFGTSNGFKAHKNLSDEYSANVAYMVSHDTLEHVNGVENIGNVLDEVEAHGAVWFMRYGYFHHKLPYAGDGKLYSSQIYVDGFVDGLVENHINPNTRIFNDLISYDKNKKLLHMSEEFFEVHQQIEEKLYETFEDKNLELISNNIIHLLEIGFEKAKSIYKDQHLARQLFYNVAQAITPFMEEQINTKKYLGKSLFLCYNIETTETNILRN